MKIEFLINGEPFAVNPETLPPEITLNTFIREHAGYTGTKFMCLEGGCGACVCAVKGRYPSTGEICTWAVNSCLTLLNVCADWEITTTEGLGNKRIGYHPIQKRLAKMNGTQCGYCSPGMVMNMYALLCRNGGEVTMEQVEDSFGGNLCRCTGYRPILDAMKSFAVDSVIDAPEGCGDIEDFSARCPKTKKKCKETCKKLKRLSVKYENGTEWYWPKSLAELFQIFDSINGHQYMLVAGNTAHGVYRRSPEIKVFIDINDITDLPRPSQKNDLLIVGGNTSLSEAIEIFQKYSLQPGFKYLRQLANHFKMIANVPVRNMGTLAGNLLIKRQHPEFPSDVFITFETLNVQVVINKCATKTKTLTMSEFLQISMDKKIINSFILKSYPEKDFIFDSYKIMPRAQNAHAYVNAGFLIGFDKSAKVKSARICFGGINPKYVHADDVETLIIGKNLFEPTVVANTFQSLSKNLNPDSQLPDPSPEYRKKLAAALYYRFLLSHAPSNKIEPTFLSGGAPLQRPLSSGTQIFDTVKKNYPITEPIEKIEALIQCSGEAKYMNDLPSQPNQLWGALVHAKKVGATIEQIDPSEALKIPGVEAFYSAKDIPGTNSFVDKTFDFVDDEEIFCESMVKYYDQPLGVVLAITSEIANMAADKVKVMYSRGAGLVHPSMLDVLKAKDYSRIKNVVEPTIKISDIKDTGDIQASGIFDIGLQYHFTMEPHTTVVVPFEGGLKVRCSTQWMDLTQFAIAKSLKMDIKDVQLEVPRLGGGYGSKISRSNLAACAAALAAYKLNRPIRFVQTIESMMGCIGKRWACHSEYEFHVNANGKIVKLRNTFYEDAGWSTNESPVGGLSTACAKNCYQFDGNYELKGNAVTSDAPSHTWCRAPGSVEGIAMIENIMEHIAFQANLDPVDARMINLKPGSKMETLLSHFLNTTNYRDRKCEIEKFNKQNRWRKKGLGITIMEFPIVYFGPFSATVAIYHGDGTVCISHGGIEMGQGLNTKVAQVAAYILGIPLEMVRIEASDTLNGANSNVTGGSVGSESVCFVVRKSCNTLLERLKPIREKMKNPTWQAIVQAAHIEKINLIASDYYKEGEMEDYIINGLCLTEVELDILTGNHLITRVDLLEDTGESLNPTIDIGQIEGAFVMLLGYFLTEQLIYDRQTGELLTNRTWNYKPPGCKDIPIDFHIELQQKSANPAGFMRSKATGEPPACLAISVIFAIREGIQSARCDAGLERVFVRLGAPTTAEHIVLNSGTELNMFKLQ